MNEQTNRRIGQAMLTVCGCALGGAVLWVVGWQAIPVIAGAMTLTAWVMVGVNLAVTGRWRG